MLAPDRLLPLLPIEIPAELVVSEYVEPGKIAAGIAVSEEDRLARLRIVTERYIRSGYIQSEDPHLRNGLYVDKYEAVSIPFVAKSERGVIGSLRLIRNTPEFGLDILTEEGISIYEDWLRKVNSTQYEWSQLAKLSNSPREALDRRPFHALMRACFAFQDYIGDSEGVAVIDASVRDNLNGRFSSFNLPQIGPTVLYMGSESTPIYINNKHLIASTNAGGHADLAQFLATGRADGYHWYQGR